jgi:hypothetical protein
MCEGSTSFQYSFFGLKFCSEVALPRLTGVQSDRFAACDCVLHLGEVPNPEIRSARRALVYTSAFTDDSGQPALKMWDVASGAFILLTYSDGHQFWFDRLGTHLWASWPPSSSLQEASTYLLGPVLGILLRFRGALCLHASAVVIDGKAVLFVGPPGAGKSTTAAALARLGHPVLADDIAMLEERNGDFLVYPAFPRVWLWPNSIDFLYGNSGKKKLPELLGEKACLSAEDGLLFQPEPLPLSEIYILNYVAPGSVLTPNSSPEDLFLSLIANTFATNVLQPAMRAQELAALGRIAAKIPIHNLLSERSPDALQAVCRRLSVARY